MLQRMIKLVKLFSYCQKFWGYLLLPLGYMRVLQKVLSLSSDNFSATFYQTYFYNQLQSISPLLKHIFVTFLPSCEKQINSLLLVSLGDTDK